MSTGQGEQLGQSFHPGACFFQLVFAKSSLSLLIRLLFLLLLQGDFEGEIGGGLEDDFVALAGGVAEPAHRSLTRPRQPAVHFDSDEGVGVSFVSVTSNVSVGACQICGHIARCSFFVLRMTKSLTLMSTTTMTRTRMPMKGRPNMRWSCVQTLFFCLVLNVAQLCCVLLELGELQKARKN